MGNRDHYRYHADLNRERFESWSSEKQNEQLNALAIGRANMSLAQQIEMQINRTKSIKETNRTNGKAFTVRRTSTRACSLSSRLIVSPEIKALIISKCQQDLKLKRLELLNWMSSNESFLQAFKLANKSTPSGKRSKPSNTYLSCIKEAFNVNSFQELKLVASQSNHKVISIEWVETKQDVGCITIDNQYHTFAIENGIFVKNSISEDYFFPVTTSGRQSRVEVLPGGENLGELTELKYFKEKIFRGLRIPSSYMSQGDQQQPAQYNDGKVGLAYFEELRFANFIRRIQNKIEKVMDAEFKMYLESIELNIDDWLFILRLPEPQNFALYRKAALNADLINTFKSIEDTKFISARLKLKEYLGWTEDQIQMNEKMLKQELGIDENSSISDLRQMYDPIQMEARTAAKVKPKFAEKGEGGAGDGGGAPPPEGPDDMGGLGGAVGGNPENGELDLGPGAPQGGGLGDIGLG